MYNSSRSHQIFSLNPTLPNAPQCPHNFKIFLALLFNKWTDLSQNFSLFISTAIFTGSGYFLVDSKCQNTVILTRLTYTSSLKVFIK